MAIKIYPKGSNVKLSENFWAYEFDCSCSRCKETPIDLDLVAYLQQIRDHFGKPIGGRRLTGYRCPEHNAEVANASKTSLHTQGMAADISIEGEEPAEIAKFAESIGVKGIGLYDTDKDGHFVHIDTRTTKSFWFGHAQQKRTTFGGAVAEEKAETEAEKLYRIRESWDKPETQKGAYWDVEKAKANCPEGYSVFNWHGNCVYYNGGGEFVTDVKEIFIRGVQDACGATDDGIAGPETLSKTVTISSVFNKEHPVVVHVQMYLYVLGYEEVGTADGTAGPKFASALAHFQQDNDCTPTGIAEEWGKTWQKLLGMK